MRINQLADIAGADDFAFDPWGTAMGLLFDVAQVLDMSDIEGDVTPGTFARWQYRRAPFTVPDIDTVADRAGDCSEGEYADDYSFGVIALAVAYRNGEITQADLIRAGDVLDRYTALLRLAGRDY